MPHFGKSSRTRLASCHPDIQEVLNEAIKHIDFSVVCGHRSEEAQDLAYAHEKSQVKWPNSKHNSLPSLAVDVAPYDGGILWDDVEAFTLLAGIIKGIAIMMGIKVRIGCDWDGDGMVKEHSFLDRPHVELIKEI